MQGSVAPLHGQRTVRIWLNAVAALVFLLVIIGGATRLTESGLSIVEWRPVTGVLPPFSQDAWLDEFDKYKTIPQYVQRNLGMTLTEFKTIYWWEWTHRLLGRLVGVAFLAPFLWFLWRGYVGPGVRVRLWGIFGLGALQGAIGWWMVASGLAERTEVSQYRLAVHLTLACLIFVVLIWTARGLGSLSAQAAPARIRIVSRLLLALVLLQIYLGAIVAGLRAGLIYNTWPLIDDALVPAGERLWFESPLWRNFFENPLTVQFDHRMVAYALFVLAFVHIIDVVLTLKQGPAVNRAWMVLLALTAQLALGVATLMSQVRIDAALAHQTMAMIVLALTAVHAHGVARAGIANEASSITPAPVPDRR
jgi:cytochrome c oxidase assembly protein subunit 15